METNIQKMQVLLETVRAGSFTRAAERLSYSQSGVSRMVADLEADWGFKVLDRSREGVVLSADGRQVMPAVEALCEEFGRLQRRVDEMRGLMRGKIAGFIAVACGAFLIAAQGLGGNMPIAGIACGIASAFCYALMVIASKGAPRIEGLENSTLQVSAAFVTALVLTLITQGAPSFLSAGVAAGIDWRAVVMLGVVNTGIGCLLYFSAVAKLPVQTVAVVGYLEPLSAVVFSAVLLGEAITPVRLMGAALIIGGAIFCELAGKRASAKAGIAQTARA